MDEFYSVKDRTGGEVIAPRDDLDRDYRYFDHPEFYSENVAVGRDGVAQVRLSVSGVQCGACIWIIERLPKLLPYVQHVRVEFPTSTVEIRFDKDRGRLSEIAQTLSSLGYPVYTRGLDNGDGEKWKREMLSRLGIAALAAANTMIIAVSLYQGYFTGIEEKYRDFFHWISLLITVPAIVYAAYPIHRGALAGLLARRPHIDQPLSIALIGAFFLSAANTLAQSDYVYFDSICVLIFFLILGRFIQQLALEKTRRTFRSFEHLLPEAATRIENGVEVRVPVTVVREGDLLAVLPGERIPADGMLKEGRSFIDESYLTGESRPVERGPGDLLLAGSLNVESQIMLEAAAPQKQSRVAKIVEEVSRSEDHKPRVEQFADRLSGYFVLVVLGLSVITFFSFVSGSVEDALNRTIALLVVSCPCALALAAPLAYRVVLGQAAREGVLLKNPSLFESLRSVSSIFFDKTGTLTVGHPVVRELRWAESVSTSDKERILSRVLLLESTQEKHPAAKGIVQYLSSLGVRMEAGSVNGVRFIPGKGILDQEREIAVGSLSFVGDFITQESSFIEGLYHSNQTTAAVVESGRAVAVFLLEDEIREEAAAVVRFLKERGISSGIISGDRRGVVQRVGSALGISSAQCFSECSPEEKAELVKEHAQAGVVMVGDGVNDLLALQQATVGVGVSGGIEAGLQAGDAFCAREPLLSVQKLFIASDRLSKLFLINYSVSLAYNILAVPFAIFGVITPLLAAVLMPLSSLFVIFTSSMGRIFPRSS